MTDPTRAAFVKQEWRYAIASDAAVKAKHPSATELTISTNLGAAAAQALANALLTSTKTYMQTYEIEFEGLFDYSTLTTGVPCFTVTSTMYPVDSRTFRASKIALDIAGNKTIVEVVG